MLVYRRTAWFGNEAQPMVGLLWPGMPASVGAMELEGPLPNLRPGVRLESDGRAWFLEGVGELLTPKVPDTTPVLDIRPVVPPRGWKVLWSRWFDQALPETAEGRWLGSLLDGPGDHWESLIGRGSGSTPVGDDYLAGWLAARWRQGLLADHDRSLLLRSLAGTTRLSRHYLWHLADGRVDPSLADFLGAEPLPGPRSPEASALAARGDLSGRATLVGLVAGLTSGE